MRSPQASPRSTRRRSSRSSPRGPAAEAEGSADGVNLLTLHRAKGLEWDAVFLPGLEDGTLPIRQAVDDEEALAEERRLLYVGLTRARRHLAISWAELRVGSGDRESRRRPSRFLRALEAGRPATAAGGAAGLGRGVSTRSWTGSGRAARVTVLPGAPVARAHAGRPTDGPLMADLRAWRTARATADAVPAYVDRRGRAARRPRGGAARIAGRSAPGQGNGPEEAGALRRGDPGDRGAPLTRPATRPAIDGASPAPAGRSAPRPRWQRARPILRPMTTTVLVLGAGFGGLELSTRLSEELGDQVEVTLIDRADAFVFGFSKLDVMFGKRTPAAVRLPYREITTPHIRFRQETITAIDPDRAARHDRSRHPRGGRPGGGARGRLRPGGHAGPGRGRPRVLLRGGRGGRPPPAPDVPIGHGDRRRLRPAVQVPARAQRDGTPARRAAARQRRPRRRPDPGRDPVREARPAVAGDIRGNPCAVRRAGDRVRAGPQGRRAGPLHARGRPRRRHPPALRPVPGHPGSSGTGRRGGSQG